MRRILALVGIATVLSLRSSVALAAPTLPTPDPARLTQLYTQLQSSPQNAYIVRLIQNERSRIRTQFDDALNAIVNDALNRQPATGITAYQQEKAILSDLETRLDQARVDVELLQDEQRRVDGGSGSGSAPVELATSGPELLAKTAMAEEKQASLQFFVTFHKERLQKLTWEQVFDQLAAFLDFAKYILVFLLIVLFERVGRANFFRGVADRTQRYRLMKVFSAMVYLLLAFWVVTAVLSQYPGILTSFAIVGAGIAVALQDPIKDLFGWVIILQKRLYRPGERITIGQITGDVIDITPSRTTLAEVPATDISRSGNVLFLPNSLVLREPVLNYNLTSDYMESELIVVVTLQSHWKHARDILKDILEQETGEFARKAQQQYKARTHHFYTFREPTGANVFVELHDRGIQFTLRFPVPIGKRRSVTSAVTEQILERFATSTPPIHLALAFVQDTAA